MSSEKAVQIKKWLLSRRLGGRELWILLVLFTLTSLVWGFAELADEVMEGATGQFDREVLLLMRHSDDISNPLGPLWVEEMGRDITALGGNVVLSLFVLAVVGYLLLMARKRMVMIVLLASLGSLGINTVLKTGFDRTRPDLVPHSTAVYTASFPSGHAMAAASIYLTLGALLAQLERRRRVKVYIMLVAITITLLVGVSRVYLGVHWPTDVLAGWTAGAGWALLCWLLAVWLRRPYNPSASGTRE